MAHGDEPFWKDSQKMIQVDIDSGIIGRAKPITLGVISDCKQFLRQILEEAKKTQKVEQRDWLDVLAKSRQDYMSSIMKKAVKDKIPINSQRLVKDVLEFMDEDAIFISDGVRLRQLI